MFKLIFVFVAVFVTNVPVANASTSLKQSEVMSCILPPYPKNGAYTADGNPSAKPGDVLDPFNLKVSCNAGYHLEKEAIMSCRQGWYFYTPTPAPECVANYCEWISKNTVSCGAEQTCRKDAPNSRTGDPDVGDGCGKVIPVVEGDIAGGRDARKQEMPWHAGVYSKRFSPYKQICGGSLVTPMVVISAAHCFWDDVKKQMPAADYAVAVGKIYRPWNDPNDGSAQKSDVKEIHIPPRFLGSAANFQQDLALLVLSSLVHYTDAVRPICLDFDYAFELRQLTSGALGKVSGWGLREEDGKPSPILQVAQLPYIKIQDCVADAPPTFLKFISGDKICAGIKTGTAVCKGDSGGGLAFPLRTDDGERFYLRGVVSGAPESEHLCNVYQWATFTHLLRHQHFIQSLLGLFSEARETPTMSRMLTNASQPGWQ